MSFTSRRNSGEFRYCGAYENVAEHLRRSVKGFDEIYSQIQAALAFTAEAEGDAWGLSLAV